MNFWKSFFSSCLGAFVALVVFTLLFVFLLVGLAFSTGEKEIAVADNSVLHLKLDGVWNEMQEENPFEGLPVPGEVSSIGMLQLKQAIAQAKDDGKIRGILLEVSFPATGFASLDEVRASLLDFKKSGKWVIAYNEVMSEPAYYLSTAADKIYLNPEGEIEFNGLTIEVGFYKKLLDKLEIKPQIFRVGEYKSAVEPFILDKMSPENREQLQALVGSIHDHMLNEVSSARGLKMERLREIANNQLIRNGRDAVEFGLIDSLMYQDQLDSILTAELGESRYKDVNLVTLSEYRKSFPALESSPNEIAVIVAQGTIVPGEGDPSDGLIASDTFVEEIRKAADSKKVKAIVVRINSPGGEFRASDMMWRAIQMAREKKPVIASMGDYAASGGYYLAMGCDTIVAQPNTITGSIGIFGMLFDMSGFLGNKLGVTFDEVKTGNYGEMVTVTRPLTEAEKNFWQKNLEEHYDTFINKAAAGRSAKPEDIRKVASGRVWTGTQAMEHNLVDKLGGLKDAIEIAAKAADVTDYRVRYTPRPKGFFQKLLRTGENVREEAVREELGEMYIWYKQFDKIKHQQGAQALMPFQFNIQ